MFEVSWTMLQLCSRQRSMAQRIISTAEAEVALVGADVDDLDEAAPGATAHEARNVAELEAADRLAVELGDDHLLMGIGRNRLQRLHVVVVEGVGGIVAGRDDAVLDDEANDEGQVAGHGAAIGELGHLTLLVRARE